MKKKWMTILPIVALFIVATLPGEDFLSVPYIIKSVIVLGLLLTAIISLFREKTKKK
ncbi:hypothetical protein [Bacteroides helcogenes]|uniref:Group-specific protein n=1 Tax=Bacteroides helcogenes (strain ATCC 35417 / DSM 20613 / JCM 6297 / CCUG 15421 / P 36-108) TaxID=693979 RepID=E6SRQ1_BACT6|nr:hypothetical protein [Bacteroides helcogenes]ADV45141.1 hypothetical protein Bache_3217 [Bacteroides helcogenes P 36-108]MDY5238700.1 hypothetical protein [Bacteroides helcogenes]